MNRRQFLTNVSAASIACGTRAGFAEATFPSRPVSVLVGGAAGSVPDVLARALSDHLSGALGQPVIVDNRPGAAGSIAIAALMRSAPDGHTLAIATMSQAVFNTYLFPKLPYDPLQDLAPVAPLVTGAMVLAGHPAAGVHSLADYVRLANAKHGQLFVAVPQLGSPPHVLGLLLDRAAGISVSMVPHRSGADALNAVVSGSIPLIIEAPTSVAPLVEAGKLRAIAVTGREREALLPQVPTAREGGIDIDGEAWIGMVAPRGTPQEVVQRLNRELNAILQDPDMRAAMQRLGFRTLKATPEVFSKLLRDEHAKWGPTIRDAGLKLE
jgi:tripartite-type tricarboxylate transporter receptor subunit TctC